ncbi:hypothetical protein IFM89_025693 [Coptis chinensis]|uniref:Uncharacterized protein n=1 Tax=Coptis chinensis TaxID=261450 RepID=A0A835LEK2_9MAGN|nr:hypothetical protein IFM89_025693 [Coptis chinensis]
MIIIQPEGQIPDMESGLMIIIQPEGQIPDMESGLMTTPHPIIPDGIGQDIVARAIRGRSTRNDQIRDLAVMGFQHYPFSDYIRNYRRPKNFKKPDFEMDFRKRFQTLLNVTDPPSDQFIIQAFKDAIGYDRSGLYNSLTRQPPFSKSELFDRAEEFARVEDDLKARQLREENLQKNKKESGRNSSNYKGQDKNKQNNFQSGQNSKPTQPNKEEKIFTPLSMKLSEVHSK